MEELDIKQMWRTYDQKLERSLQLNYKIIREMQTRKAEARIGSFKMNQVLGVIAGMIWLLLLAFLILHHLDNIYFTVSAGFILLFNVFAVAVYIRHLVLLSQVNISESITGAQQKLATIQASLNNVGRILVLQAPFYCTFWYNDQLIAHAGMQFWVINFVVVAIFVAGSVCIFRALTYKNINKKWVRAIVEGFGEKSLIKAVEFLNEIEEYKAEELK